MRHLILILVITLTAVLSAGAVFLEFDADPRGYFNKDNPERLLLEEFEREHGRESTAVLMLVPDDQDIFSDALLDVVKQASKSLSSLPGVKRVSSVTDYGARNSAQLRSIWKRNQSYLRPFMSEKGGVSAVVAFLDPAKADLLETVEQVEVVRQQLRGFHPNITFRLSGEAPMDATFMKAIEQDLIWLAPFQVVLIVALLLICLQSIRATVILLVVLGCATGITMGTAGWLGFQLNGVTSAAPMILLGIAVATCIHLLIAWQQDFRTHRDTVRALKTSTEINAFPVFLATLSTIASFLCLNFSDSPPFQQLGNLIALGLSVTWVLAFTLLPVLVYFLPPGGASRRVNIETEWLHLGRCVVRWRAGLVAVLCVAAAGSVWGVKNLSFDDRFSQYFSERFEFRRDTDFMEKNLTGLSILHFPIEYSSQSRERQKQLQTFSLAFAEWLEGQPEVARVDGFAGAVKLARANGLPDDVYDRIRPVVTAVLSNATSADIKAVADRSNDWLRAYAPLLSKGAVGTSLLAANLSERNLNAMVTGTIAALVLVSCILLFSLGNFRLGVISLLPNLLPMLLAYGFWGIALGEMSFAATVVMALTFGIIVDDTVHFLAKYNRYRRQYGFGSEWAVAESFRTVGIAITSTTLAVGSGFLALCFSGFLVNYHLGLLTLMILFAAWLSVLFLLPPLLIYLDNGKVTR